MEGFFLYNQAEQLMEQYPLTVTETAKGRGALICITECGEKILKEYKGSAVRAEILHDVAEYLNKAGIKTDGDHKNDRGGVSFRKCGGRLLSFKRLVQRQGVRYKKQG